MRSFEVMNNEVFNCDKILESVKVLREELRWFQEKLKKSLKTNGENFWYRGLHKFVGYV